MDPVAGGKFGFSGQLYPGVQVKVMDVSTKEILPPSHKGQIFIKSDQVSYRREI